MYPTLGFIFCSLWYTRMIKQLYEIIKQERIDQEALMCLVPVLKELNDLDFYNPAHIYNVLEHSVKAAETVKEPFLRVALIFHDVGKLTTAKQEPHRTIPGKFVTKFKGHEAESVRITEDILGALLPEKQLGRLLKLIELHDTQLISDGDETLMDNLISTRGTKFVKDLLKIQWADMMTHEQSYYQKMQPKLNHACTRFAQKCAALQNNSAAEKIQE